MTMLEGKVKVPGLGEVDKKYAALGALAAVGVVGIVYIRKRKAGGSAGTTSGTDPAGNTGSIDPATGYVYGSPEDQQALSYSQGAGAGYASGIDPATGVPYAYETGAGYGAGSAGTTNTPTPLTRDQWLVQAINDLNAPSLQNIAPAIWAGLPVTAADKNVFLEAVALEGPPPGGYPTPIKLLDTNGHPGHKPKPTPVDKHDVVVPAIVGDHEINAGAKLAVRGLHPVWQPRGPHRGESAVVQATEPPAGTHVDRGSRVTVHLRIG